MPAELTAKTKKGGISAALSVMHKAKLAGLKSMPPLKPARGLEQLGFMGVLYGLLRSPCRHSSPLAGLSNLDSWACFMDFLEVHAAHAAHAAAAHAARHAA
ncbi:hypothetical protein, partial [Mesorhizobium sp.]|uniref:hypothetical protein n=1 Tax=Mesorhizobium sp. TaxID=1871066 RepID=UPI0025C67E87